MASDGYNQDNSGLEPLDEFTTLNDLEEYDFDQSYGVMDVNADGYGFNQSYENADGLQLATSYQPQTTAPTDDLYPGSYDDNSNYSYAGQTTEL
jgi:hypothetical protein